MVYARSPTFFDRLLAVSGLLVSLTAFIHLFSLGDAANAVEATQSTTFHVFSSLVYFFSCLRLSTRPSAFLFVTAKAPALTLLCLLSFASLLWSVNPLITAIRGSALVLNGFFGLYLAIFFPPKELLRCISFTFLLTCLCSLVVIYIFPSYGIHQSGIFIGVPRGVFLHKNVLGPRMSFIALYFMVLATQKGGPHRGLNGLYSLLSLYLVFLSESREAWAISAITSAALIFFRAGKKGRLFLGGLYLAGFSFILLSLHVLLDSMGRDITFSGRTYIWEESLRSIIQRPFFGYGFGVFWSEEAAAEISRRLGYPVSHAHSGPIELLLALGVSGLFLYVAALFQLIRNLRFFQEKSAEKIFCILFLVYIAGMNLADSAMLTPNTIYWLFFVVFASYGLIFKKQSQNKAGDPKCQAPCSL